MFYKKQFGFRNNHSTTRDLLEITEEIKQGCDAGQFTCGVFLDLQKAFDTVNHTILLKNLNYYGQPFLEDRKQLLVYKVVDQQKNESNMASLKNLFYNLFFLFYLLLICTRQLKLARCITLLMIQVYSWLINHSKRLINILTEILN